MNKLDFEIMNIVDRASAYAIQCHGNTNHLYDGKPYETHLKMVVDIAKRFTSLIPEEAREDVLAACWAHDVIEDCRQTYNDVWKATNSRVADLAYALTNEKGKTRAERANDKHYHGIRATPYAPFVKICDRIANYLYSKNNNSRMTVVYEREMGSFIINLYDKKYDEMFYLLKKT